MKNEKKKSRKRKLYADPKYGDMLVSRMVNSIMLDGKKNTARKIVYGALDFVGKKTKQEPIEIFRKAISNVAPVLEVRSRRVGGATYQVPVEVREERRVALAIRWIKNYSKARRDKTMSHKLAQEILAASSGEGSSVKKRDDTHRMAEANKAFAHFKW